MTRFPNKNHADPALPLQVHGWRAGERALPGRAARVGRGMKDSGPGKGLGRTKETFQ
ncbi:MAG: hypothetical protein AAFY19_11240 [Pseudomonadota bacterium]